MSAADEYFKKADQALKKGNNEYAVELLFQGVMMDPNRAAERRKLHKVEATVIQERGGNPQGGMAIRFKVMPMQANVKKLSMQKKWEEAVVEIEKCLRLQPQNAPTLFQLAEALEGLGHDDSSIGTLEEVIELDKGAVEAYRKLGVLWAKKGEPEKAITYWEKVQLYKPDDKEAGKAIRDLSAATMVKKAEDRKKQSGDASFKALLKSEEESAELEKKSKIIRTDEDRREAIKFKKDELRKDPTSSRLWRELGDLFRDLRLWRESEASYRKAMEVNAHDLMAPEKLGQLRELRLEDDIKNLEKELEVAREAGAPNLAELEAQLKVKTQEALVFKAKEYDRRTKAHPTDFELKVLYGEVLLQMGQHDEAIAQFQKAVTDPKFRTRALTQNGICFREKGLHKVAKQQLLEALKGAGEEAGEVAKDIKYNLAVVSEEEGSKEEALDWYQQIMAVDISFRDVSARVSRLMQG